MNLHEAPHPMAAHQRRSDDVVLVGLCGRAGSGKDTAADHLCAHYGFVRASFAEGPRVMLEALLAHLGEDHAWLYEPAMKERPIPTLGASYRKLMQTLGTDWGRDMVGWRLWIDILARHLGLDNAAPVHDRIVVTDVRYPNEAVWLKGQGGHLLMVSRTTAPPVREHSSEQHFAQLQHMADTMICNDDTRLESLHSLLDGTMADLGCELRPALAEGIGA